MPPVSPRSDLGAGDAPHDAALDPALQRAVLSLSSPAVLVGARAILSGDELALLPGEANSIAAKLAHARRASGAARIVARGLMAKFGIAECPIVKSSSGAPIWPSGILGSLAHDDAVAVAAVARSMDASAIGIDVEPAEPLPRELHELALSRRERAHVSGDPVAGRLMFAAKEAVYKALAAFDGTLLDYHDIETEIAAGRARIADGRCLALRYSRVPRVIVLAIMDRLRPLR